MELKDCRKCPLARVVVLYQCILGDSRAIYES